MTIDKLVGDCTTIGRVTGERRVIDDAGLFRAVMYAADIKKGEAAVTCPECEIPVTHNSAIDDVPTGKKDIYGHEDYASGFRCPICEYTTTEWPKT